MDREVLYKLIYELDFIDLRILEQIVQNEYMIALPILIKRMERINVWNRGIIRRRLDRLKREKVLWFEEGTSPIIIEVYNHQEKEIVHLKELIENRLILVK